MNHFIHPVKQSFKLFYPSTSLNLSLAIFFNLMKSHYTHHEAILETDISDGVTTPEPNKNAPTSLLRIRFFEPSDTLLG